VEANWRNAQPRKGLLMNEKSVIEVSRTMRSFRQIPAALLVALVLMLPASPVWACYAVVVGREASSDGSVLLGHAEQNGGTRMLNFRRVSRQKHDAQEQVVLRHGGRLPEVGETWAFLWSELPGLEFSDNYLNEWGVAVVSDYCPSREDDAAKLIGRGEIREGGIGYMLRRLIALRAKSAREGVTLAGEWIERFGYVDSGRTYVIADPREAWLLAVVRGRHWVARRVADDEVVVLPNVYITDTVDFGDPKNCLVCSDLIAYSAGRGWFSPRGTEPFRFDHVYGAPGPAADPRRWKGQQLVSGKEIPWPPTSQPFGIKPPEKLTVAAVAKILRGVIPADRRSGFTQEGAVFQLRSGLPPEIGCIYWRTSGEPSMNVLLPWYLGIRETPSNYYRAADLKEAVTLDHHFKPPAETFIADRRLAWWLHQALQDLVRQDLPGRLPAVRAAWDSLEKRAFENQASVEKDALGKWQRDPDSARTFLTEYCAHLAAEADREAQRLMGTSPAGPSNRP
jgi:dipeptidase